MSMEQQEFDAIVCGFSTPDFARLARLLLEHGDKIDVNRRGDYPFSALERACGYGRLDVVKLLVNRGAQVNVQSYVAVDGTLLFVSPPPIVYAIDFPDVLEYLFDLGDTALEYTLTRDLTCPPRRGGRPILAHGAHHQHSVLLPVMVKFGTTRRLGARRMALLQRMLRAGVAHGCVPKNDLLQVMLNFWQTYFTPEFLAFAESVGLTFDPEFDADEMHALPAPRHGRHWWMHADVVTHLLRRCGSARALHMPVHDPTARRTGRGHHTYTTLDAIMTRDGIDLLKHVEVVACLDASTIIRYRKVLRERAAGGKAVAERDAGGKAAAEWPELEARFVRIRRLCFRMYHNHIARKYAPDGPAVARMVREWHGEADGLHGCSLHG